MMLEVLGVCMVIMMFCAILSCAFGSLRTKRHEPHLKLVRTSREPWCVAAQFHDGSPSRPALESRSFEILSTEEHLLMILPPPGWTLVDDNERSVICDPLGHTRFFYCRSCDPRLSDDGKLTLDCSASYLIAVF